MDEPLPPGLAPRADEPAVPEDVDLSVLPRSARAELRGLPADLAKQVGSHLVAAGELIDDDPQLAYAHAEAARRRAARLPIVREAAAEAAYAAGEYAAALNEFRAITRMNGGSEYVPLMADCERALGKPQAALRRLREGRSELTDPDTRNEATLVEAGARDDMGQHDEARRLLRNAATGAPGSPLSRARLMVGYADLLHRSGDTTSARTWLEKAREIDPASESGVVEQLEALDGMVLDVDLSEPEPDHISEPDHTSETESDNESPSPESELPHKSADHD